MVPIMMGNTDEEINSSTYYQEPYIRPELINKILTRPEDSDSYDQLFVIPVSQIKLVRQLYKKPDLSALATITDDTWLKDLLKVMAIMLGGILVVAVMSR